MEIAHTRMFVIVVRVGKVVYVVFVSIIHMSIIIFDEIYSLAVCSPACQHSSNCTAPNTCVCSAGYNGSYCQSRKFVIAYFQIDYFFLSLAICTSPCLNGGTCVS